jgi:hypothetical protein
MTSLNSIRKPVLITVLLQALNNITRRIQEYIQSVDDAGNISKDCQQDTDQEISTTSTLYVVS